MKRKYLCVFLTLIVFFSFSATVHAATISDTGWSYSTSGDGTATCSNGQISLSATGKKVLFWWESRTAQITLTNNTGATQVLKGNIVIEGDFGSYSITLPDNTSIKGSSAYTYTENITMANGATLTISVTSPSGSGKITCKYTPDVTQSSSKTITCKTAANGTYTVNGQTVTSVDFNTGDTLTLAATPNEGYVCLGFLLDGKTLLPMGNNRSIAWKPTDSYTITPVFAKITNTTAPFSVNGIRYYTWETAFTAAGNSGTVVLVENYELPLTYPEQGMTGAGNCVTGSDGNLIYTIPEGTTLLLPYTSGAEGVESKDGTLPHANYTEWGASQVSDLNPNTGLYLTMTIPDGLTVQNNGRFVIGGKFASANGYSGACHGDHSNVILNGTLKMGNNSVLSSVGYILGKGNIITTGTGAAIYQPFVIMDFGGGGYTVGSSGQTNNAGYGVATGNFPGGEGGVMPFQCYTMLNIQPNITLNYGNTMYGYCDMAATNPITKVYGHNYTTAAIIGNTGLISLTKSGSKAEISYDTNASVTSYPKVGRTKIVITGDASFGEIAMKVTIDVSITQITADTHSSTITFPIPYNYDITLSGGTFTVPNHLAIHPGASLKVASDATLNLTGSGKRFIIYDGLNDHKKWSSASTVHGTAGDKQYPTAAQLQAAGLNVTGSLIVDGTLNIGSGVKFGGTVQTGGTGKIIVDPNATMACTSQYGVVGSWKYATKTWSFSGATVRTLKAQVRKRDGTVIDLVQNTTYYGVDGEPHKIDNYSYRLYTDSANPTTVYTGVGEKNSDGTDGKDPEALEAPIVGSWCTVNHSTLETQPAKAPTCTDIGWDPYVICKECGSTYVEKPVLGHDWVHHDAKAPTCTEIGWDAYDTCSRCDYSTYAEKAATGHTEETIPGKDATCTETGLTEGKRCSVCKEVLVAQDVIPVLPAVAQIGEALYPNLAAAVDAASAGAKITLLKDTDETITINKCLVILNGEYTASNVKAAEGLYLATYTNDPAKNYIAVVKGITLASAECSYDAEVILRMKFYIPDELKNGYTIALHKDGRWPDRVDLNNKSFPVANMEQKDDGLYWAYIGVASGEMTRIVTTKVLDGNNNPCTFYRLNGDEIQDKVYSFSVREYVEKALKQFTDEKQKALVKALAVYGGYAQQYFNVSKDDPAYSVLPVDDAALTAMASVDENSITNTVSVSGTATGITPKSLEPFLDSATYLRIRFVLAEGADIKNYTFTYTSPNSNIPQSVDPVREEKTGRYYVDIPKIPAAYLDNDYTLTIAHKTDGTSCTVNASVLAWVKLVLQSGSSNENRIMMAKALFLYSQAATDYFGK